MEDPERFDEDPDPTFQADADADPDPPPDPDPNMFSYGEKTFFFKIFIYSQGWEFAHSLIAHSLIPSFAQSQMLKSYKQL